MLKSSATADGSELGWVMCCSSCQPLYDHVQKGFLLFLKVKVNRLYRVPIEASKSQYTGFDMRESSMHKTNDLLYELI